MKSIHKAVADVFLPTNENMVNIPVDMLEYIMSKKQPSNIRGELIRMIEAAPAKYIPNGRASRLNRILSLEDKLREMRGFLQLCKLQEALQDTPSFDDEEEEITARPVVA